MKVPTQEEYRSYDGAHCFRLWRSLSEDWNCPACGRSKFEIMRWTFRCKRKDPQTGRCLEKYEGWVAGLHKHHDHGADYVWRSFFDSDETHEQWRQRYTAAMRFPETVICDQCNAADGRAKRRLGLPAHFSFTPDEIGRFVLSAPHEQHHLDIDEALKIYRGFHH